MQAQRILETCLYVADLSTAEQFYTQVLGLKVYSSVEGRHVFLRCGQNMLLLFNPTATRQPNGDVPTHGAQGSGHAAFAINAVDIPAWQEQLHQHQVKIETEITWPNAGHSLYFRDPSGNSIELATPSTWELPEMP